MSTVPNAATPATRRAGSPHVSMFLRMLVRAAVMRRGRAASALLAMVVAAAVATAMMNLYVDVQAKLRKEFRSYGANVVVVGKDGTFLPTDAAGKVEVSSDTIAAIDGIGPTERSQRAGRTKIGGLTTELASDIRWKPAQDQRSSGGNHGAPTDRPVSF